MNEGVANLIKNYKPTSAIDLIRIVKAYVSDTDAVIEIIEKIAAGSDGIQGTQDDLVSPEIINTVKVLLSHGVMREITEEIMVKSVGGCTGCFFN